jgi:hypothetical protein
MAEPVPIHDPVLVEKMLIKLAVVYGDPASLPKVTNEFISAEKPPE